MNMKIFAKLSTVLCFLSALIIGCTEKETQVEVSSVSLNTATVEMVEGETFSLVATVLPKDAEYDGVTWASSNASVASVNSGTVTAVKEGTATITASAGGKSATCNVKVSAKIVAVTSITLDKTSLSMQVGDTETLTATIKPEDATDKTIVWTSSDEAVVSVSNGKITALKSGKATITAKSGTCSADCVVTISVNTESITLDKTTLSLAVGESAILTATVRPDDATDKTVTWSSSDESIAKVDKGKVTALKIGSATVTAIAASFSVSCRVTVIHPDNIIYYTSTDGNIVKPFNGSAFGANIISNEYNDGLGKIVFDSPVMRIGNNAFYECKTLRSMTIPESVISIGDNAYYYCSALGNVRLSDATLTIGKRAFYKCGNLNIKLTNKITTIGDEAFGYAFRNTIIEIPASVKQIGESAFSFSGISKIILNDGLVSIGDDAFWASDLSEIAIPNTVTSIGVRAFADCYKLRSEINIPGSVSKIESRLFASSPVVSVTINDGTTELDSWVFQGCGKLTTVNLPSTIQNMGYSTFANCLVLANIYLRAQIPPFISPYTDIFKGSNSEVNIWVPRASVEAYKEKWSTYKDNIKGYDF